MIAGAADEVVKACSLAAEYEDVVAGEVELVVVEGGTFIETDDPEIVALEVFERANEINDPRDAEMLGCAGAGLCSDRTERGGTALGEDDSIDSGAVSYAEESAEVLRIFDAVEGEKQSRRAAGLYRAGLEKIFDGEELL